MVLGGGLPGVCAAMQAARLGEKVILVEQRNTLGGNCGPEIGVHPSDAHRFHAYMASTGIVGELIEDAAFCQAKTVTNDGHYNISMQFSLLQLKALKKVGVTVLLHHYAHTPVVENGKIVAVLVDDMNTHCLVKIAVNGIVIDDTGDGNVSAAAGAQWRMGREAKNTYDERSAPEQSDSITMGASLVAYTRRCNHNVPFIPSDDLPKFHPGYWGEMDLPDWNQHEARFFFPTETGGEVDIVEDSSEIYERLLDQLYSAWDKVKNGTQKDIFANYELTWVSPHVAKRESRRFVGEYTMTQTDVENGRIFDDAIAAGGFALDIHLPREENKQYVYVQYYSVPPVYSIPFRSIYSKDIDNLLFASRLMSVSHLAHGTVRLQRTLSTVGQAAGVAAYMCSRLHITPREIYEKGLVPRLQQLLLREDASVPFVVKDDPYDLSRLSRVSADSELHYEDLLAKGEYVSLDTVRGLELRLFDKKVSSVSFLVRNSASKEHNVTAILLRYDPDRPWQEREDVSFRKLPLDQAHNEVEWGNDLRLSQFKKVSETIMHIPPAFDGYAEAVFDAELGSACSISNDDDRLLVLLKPCPDISLVCSTQAHEACRGVCGCSDTEYQVLSIPYMHRITPCPPFGEAVCALDGINRRWSSAPLHMWKPTRLPAVFSLQWSSPIHMDVMILTFDTLTHAWTDMPFECGERVSPQTVRDFTVDFLFQGEVVHTIATKDNYHRRVVLHVPHICVDCLQIRVCNTWRDDVLPGLYDIRIYDTDQKEHEIL